MRFLPHPSRLSPCHLPISALRAGFAGCAPKRACGRSKGEGFLGNVKIMSLRGRRPWQSVSSTKRKRIATVALLPRNDRSGRRGDSRIARICNLIPWGAGCLPPLFCRYRGAAVFTSSVTAIAVPPSPKGKAFGENGLPRSLRSLAMTGGGSLAVVLFPRNDI